eukprot:5889123-Pyramimonas_sp.AAC.1
MIHGTISKDQYARRWADWKAWAQDAASAQAGAAARAYPKAKAPAQGPRASEGWALQGDTAIAALQEEWGRHWLTHDCALSPVQHAEADAGPLLDGPARHQVWWAHSEFKHDTGLGAD